MCLLSSFVDSCYLPVSVLRPISSHVRPRLSARLPRPGVPQRRVLSSTSACFSETELDLALSFSLSLLLLSVSLSPLEVFFPSRPRHSVWLDYFRCSSTTVWRMRVLVLFWDVMGTGVIVFPIIIVILVLLLPLLRCRRCS